jgi:putative membrane protein
MKDSLIIYLKGLLMGAADVVPGVSGGTIAFITGIYKRLLAAIAAFDLSLISTFKTAGVVGVWRKVDGSFLAALLAGIITSMALLARVIHYALEHHSLWVWSFFFGLVAASVVHIWRQISAPSVGSWVLLLIGAVIAYSISIATPVDAPTANWFIFVAASIAICATILPGISGSFILLLLGVYPIVIEAIGYGDFVVIGHFVAGAILGLLTFVKGVSYVFNRFESQTLAVLTGFLIGSLNSLWPWKVTVENMVNRKGELVPIVQDRVLPGTYESSTGVSGDAMICVGMMLVGLMLVLVLELSTTKEST